MIKFEKFIGILLFVPFILCIIFMRDFRQWYFDTFFNYAGRISLNTYIGPDLYERLQRIETGSEPVSNVKKED